MRRALIAALVLLAGCGPGRTYQEPSAELPAGWHHAPGQAAAVPLAAWWTAFGDARLKALVAAAVAANLDLQRAAARVSEAGAVRRAAAWSLAPQGGVGAAADRHRGPGGVDERMSVGIDASWEVDLFGGLRRGVEAATADRAALAAERDAVAAAVVAETVAAWVDLISANGLADLARRDLADLARARDLVAARVDGGTATAFDLARAEAQVAARATVLPELERRRTGALTRLAVLLARPAGEVLAEAQADGTPLHTLVGEVVLPDPLALLPAGVPADLLRARPDLRRAERRLAAAVARIGVAEHDLYPRLSLTGSFGLASDRAADLGDSGSRFWIIGPVLRWPLLSLPRVRARVAAAEAAAHDAELAWRAAVLTAMAEVEDALAALLRADEGVQAQRRALAAHEVARRHAEERWRAGAGDLLALLTEQTATVQARLQLGEARRLHALRLVALARALGGGWPASAAP